MSKHFTNIIVGKPDPSKRTGKTKSLNLTTKTPIDHERANSRDRCVSKEVHSILRTVSYPVACSSVGEAPQRAPVGCFPWEAC